MKKIASIIIISIVTLLVAATVVLALVPLTKYNAINEGYNLVTVYKNSYTNYKTFMPEDDEFEKFEELHKKGLKQNILSTMFQGALKDKSSLEKVTSTSLQNVITDNAGYFVEFEYDSEQTLIWDNKEYTYKDGTTEKVAKYTSLVLEVKNTDSFANTTVYVVNGSTYMFKITCEAHQAELFSFVNDLTWPGVNA